MSRPVALACAALVASLAAPAAASAATVTPLSACMHSGAADLSLSSSGWAPGAALTFKLGGKRVGAGTADAAGSFSNRAAPFTVPVLSPGRPLRTLELTAADGAGATARPAGVKVVRRTVTVPAKARPSRRVTYRAYGFPRGRRLFLHVRRGQRTLGSFALGRPAGACGLLHKRLRYMPLRRWRTGTYDFWFSNTRRFRARATLYGYRVSIYRPRGG